jgi:preprotein translocase subunit YajC
LVAQIIMILATFFQAGAPASGFSSFLIPLGLMFAIMYFMVIMPQQRQRKKVQEMLSAIKAGDRVITSGGIYGTINGLDGDSVILKIATDPQVKIRVARSAIAQVETPEDAK